MKKKVAKKLIDFMKDESGVMSKDNILKIGIGTVSALGLLTTQFSSNVCAQHNHTYQAINEEVACAVAEGGGYKLVPVHINYQGGNVAWPAHVSYDFAGVESVAGPGPFGQCLKLIPAHYNQNISFE